MYGPLICDAIIRRRLLRFRYKDHASSTTVEPYTFGLNKAEHFVLSAWLVAGATHEDQPPYWRLYRLDEMHQVEVLQESFATNRPGYKPNDSRFARIDCRVRPPGA